MKLRDLEGKIEKARALVLTWLKNDPAALPGACFYHALAMNKLYNLSIAAGSYSWLFTTFDNGSNPTHFSCMFDQTAEMWAKRILEQGVPEVPILPEMHCFNILEGKVLDLTTLYLPEFAHRTGGFVFEKPLTPPAYLWDNPKGPNYQWLYQVHPVATQLARAIARKKGQP